jgi:rhodanese-related sulfurtransferase
MIQKIDAAAAVRLLDAGKAIAVDVREPDEFAAGHIPGAISLPLNRVGAEAAQKLPGKDTTWLVYCRTGRRSAEALQKLDAMGYTALYDLGGILGWPYETESDF